MIVLHTAFLDGVLLVWGERPAAAGPAKTTGRKRPAPAPSYPYDAGAGELLASLEQAGLQPAQAPRECLAWLPSRGNAPVPSSSLIAEPPASTADPVATPWRVTACPLTDDEAVTFLCACVGKQTVAAGVIVGADLAWWSRALRFAGSLVARQQYLAGMALEGERFVAQWQPVFVGADRERLAGLVRGMPDAARAVTASQIASPPEESAEGVLRRFVTRSVDYLVRGAQDAVPRSVRPSRPRTAKAGRGRKPAFESVHDAWLHSLRSADAVVDYDSAELTQLARQIEQWRRPIEVAVESPIQLCFRLEEPAEPLEPADADGPAARQSNPDWYVRFLLQPHDDPSLLVPAADVWTGKAARTALARHFAGKIPEFVLSCLGQAAGICPDVAAGLKTARPEGYSLDTTGAFEFLTEKAMTLEQAGYAVLLPAWWTRKGTKTRLTAHAQVKSPKMQGGSGLSLDDIVQFDWEIALGDQRLSLEELERLARIKAPLVQLRGQWVQVSSEEIRTALAFWKAKRSRKATVRDVVQMALGGRGAEGGLDFGGVQASGAVEDLLERLREPARVEMLETPPAFAGTLRPYQQRGYSWLAFLRRWGLGGCLADDMGLGKTIQTLALIQRDWHATSDGGSRLPVLLVCPTSVVNNWRKEAARFTPELPVLVHHGADRLKGAAFRKAVDGQAIVISSYALLHRDAGAFEKIDWAGIILDEAQNIKNPETKQARAARSLQAGYRFALTGTPVENNVGDLWSIMEFLNPGFLGVQAEFKRKFFVPIQAGGDPEAAERLKRVTGPFILRRLKTDKTIISDLPDKQEMKVFCTLTEEQASLYAAVLKDTEKVLDNAAGIQRKGIILATLSKLKQVCNHPAQFLGDNSRVAGRSGKLARLTEMLEEILEVGDRVLVFSQFAEMGGLLRSHLQETFGRPVLFLHGQVAKKKRDEMVEDFQRAGGPAIFILSLKAGGTGLNLTAANHVFHFDRWWNPAVENQATDRAFRIGQTRNVQVHIFLCAGTLEDKIDEMIERKQEIARNVVGTGEGWLTELSNEEIRNVFALRQEAVE
jgi:SNF2 family DNA or RNA helicase